MGTRPDNHGITRRLPTWVRSMLDEGIPVAEIRYCEDSRYQSAFISYESLEDLFDLFPEGTLIKNLLEPATTGFYRYQKYGRWKELSKAGAYHYIKRMKENDSTRVESESQQVQETHNAKTDNVREGSPDPIRVRVRG